MVKKIFFIAINLFILMHNSYAMQGLGEAIGSNNALNNDAEEAGSPRISPRRKLLTRQTSLDDLEKMHAMIRQNNETGLKAMLEEGKKAFVDETKYGKSKAPALKTAIVLKKINMVELLLQHDLNVDWQDENGRTYLHMLIESKLDADAIKIFELLLDSNANLNLKNNKNESIIDLVQKKGFDQAGLSAMIVAKRPDLAHTFTVRSRPKISPINLGNISPRIQQLQAATQAQVRLEEEEKTETFGSLGYFALGAVGTIAAIKVYTLLFKPKEQQKKSNK